MPRPVIRMAPNPRRLTVRSPPTSMVPAAAAVGCAFTRYLLLVLTVSLSRPPPAPRRGERARTNAGGEHEVNRDDHEPTRSTADLTRTITGPTRTTRACQAD